MLTLNDIPRLSRYCLLSGILLIITSCGGDGISEERMLENARKHIADDNLSAAAIELRNTLQKNSSNAEARYLLGNISLKIGLLESADKEFRRAALAGWNEEQTQLALARVYIARKKSQKLLDDINIKDSWSVETRADIMALRALAEAGVGQVPQALVTLEKSKQLKADAFHVFKTTALFQLAGIRDGGVADTLKQALSLYPDNTELLLLHAFDDSSQQNYTRATDTFKKIISFDPASLVTLDGRNARIGLARIQIIKSRFEQADATLKPLLEINDKDPVANYLSALLAYSKGDYHEAEKYMRKLLHLVPEHIQAQQLMGNIKYALSDYDQAAHHLTTSVMKTPDNLTVYNQLVRTYIALNKPIEAKLTLEKALAIRPNDAEALALLSQIKFNEGNVETGFNVLRHAIEANPNNSGLYKQLARAYIATGDAEQASDAIQRYQSLSKDTVGTQKLIISSYLKTGELDKALDTAQKMLEENPRNPEIITLNGQLYAASNDNQKARAYFDKALQIEADFSTAIIELARIEKNEGNLIKAIELYTGLVDAKKGGVAPMKALSEIAKQQQNRSEMLYWLEQAREASPADTESRAILANYYLASGYPVKADKYIREAIAIAPDQIELLALNGKILLAQKRYNEALLPLKKVATRLPESANARIVLAENYLLLKMATPARNHLLVALSIDKNSILALSLLAETELLDGNLEKSLEYAMSIQSLKPDSFAGYLHEGEVWLAKQEYKKAFDAYTEAWQRKQTADIAKKSYSAAIHFEPVEKAVNPLLLWLTSHPDDNATRFFLAAAYQNADHNEVAIQEYEKILESTPDSSSLLNNLAWLYSLEDDPKAIDLAERAYRLSPEDPGVLDTYGWVLISRGQVEKAKRLLDLSMKKAPKNLEIRYHYAVALIKSGDNDKGYQMLEELIDSKQSFVGRHDAKKLLDAKLSEQ